MKHGSLSPAQLVGYVAFALGVLSFLQKSDRRLKGAVALQASSYALHFALLGSATAAAASLVTFVRALLSLYTRSPLVAVLLIGVNLALGLAFAHAPLAWLPLVASSVGTLAFFLLRGVNMRLVLLSCTLLWLVNNLLLGSIGGSLLELVIGTVNASTIWRMRHELAASARRD